MTNGDRYLPKTTSCLILADEIADFLNSVSTRYGGIHDYIVDFFEKPIKITLTDLEKEMLEKLKTQFYKVGKNGYGSLIFKGNDNIIVIREFGVLFENFLSQVGDGEEFTISELLEGDENERV